MDFSFEMKDGQLGLMTTGRVLGEVKSSLSGFGMFGVWICLYYNVQIRITMRVEILKNDTNVP